MNRKRQYPVIITGTGPGNPELLTVKAGKAIRKADVILYDCMPAHYVLELKGRNTEVIALCKNHEAGDGEQVKHLEDIIDHLEECYRSGRRIVRLKAGDPFMYGGAGIEARMLAARQVPFEIIPGLTAAAAASSLYGISISEKYETDMVIYYIAFKIDDNYLQIRQIAASLKVGATLVLYMADDNLAEIFEVLKEEGVPGSMPVVVAGMVSLPDEDCAEATIETIREVVLSKEMLMPFTYFIGYHVSASVKERIKMPQRGPAFQEGKC